MIVCRDGHEWLGEAVDRKTYPSLHHRDLIGPTGSGQSVGDEDDGFGPVAGWGRRDALYGVHGVVLGVCVERGGLQGV